MVRELAEVAGDLLGDLAGRSTVGVDRDVRVLEDHERRIWYVHAWALHHWLLREAPEDLRRRFAAWQGVMENLETTPRTVDRVGREQFLIQFRGKLEAIDSGLAEWIRTFH